MKKKVVLIITVIVLIILVCANYIQLNKYLNLLKSNNSTENTVTENTENVENSEENDSEEELDALRLSKLQSMGERARMETYFYSFITYIESNEYEKAYNLLYEDFKEEYFPTIDEFIEYAEKTYPENAAYNYNDIQRYGTIYILKVEIIDTDGSKEQENKTQRVVIQENDFNDFVMSFQLV